MRPSVVTGPSHQIDDPEAVELVADEIPYFRTPVESNMARVWIRRRWPIFRALSMVHALKHRIATLLDAYSFDVVHAHSPTLCGLAASRAARPRGIPLVYEIRSFWEDSAVVQNKTAHRSLRYQLSRNLETFVARRADAVVGISSPIVQELRSRGVNESRLFHVPNGVDVQDFTSIPREAALAADLHLKNVPTIGYIGTLFPWEGIPWLVRAAAALHQKGTQFQVLIIGDGAVASEVRNAIRDFGAGAYISFLGRVPHVEVKRYYSLIDVLVYPRLNVRTAELVTPLKPLEAMALSKAILGSSVGGIRELIEPEVTGLLFEPENIGDFCLQAARLLSDEKLRHALGQRARETVVGQKDWQILASRYKEIYARAAHRK